jgi:hypothetical protein
VFVTRRDIPGDGNIRRNSKQNIILDDQMSIAMTEWRKLETCELHNRAMEHKFESSVNRKSVVDRVRAQVKSYGYVVHKAALGQAFFEYLDFRCHSFHRLHHTSHHPSCGTGAIGQILAHVQNSPSLTPTEEGESYHESKDEM